ncbi:MAG: glycosyltransferase family 2 protein, partial [Actinobacteria bacterium]|nr:glycosyltransferase family 2 protein [Actinomycetota bacterium]
KVVYEPAARAEEEPTSGVREEWERRTRVIAGMLDVVVRRRELLLGHGSTSLQLWGHRVVRSTAGPVAHVGLLGLALASAPRSRPAQAFLAVHALAAAGAAADARGLPTPALLRTAGSVGLLQLVGLGGTWRYLRGDRPALLGRADALGQARTIDALYRSAAQGHAVALA